MRKLIALVALAGACATCAGAGRDLLVLQCGSDWCVSGESVRRVFESAEFRRALGGRYDLRVYDDMEEPTPKVAAANEKVAPFRVASRRLPAITCLTEEPRRLFAQLENIPFDVTPQSLAGLVEAAARGRNEAEALFGKGRGSTAQAADAAGRAFELLEAQVGRFSVPQLYEGPFAWVGPWAHLQEIDADDRFGWRQRFLLGDGFDIVERATEYGRGANRKAGEKFLASLARIPTNHLSVVQRQAVEMAAFAYRTANGTGSQVVSASDTERLKAVLAMGRDTVWGQCALGLLKMAGERIATAAPCRADVRARPADAPAVTTPFKLAAVEERLASVKPGPDGFTEQEKRDIALCAVLSRIGARGWDALKARPGARAFLRAFFSSREWMEDFAWSGTCDRAAESLLALESLFFQDNGRWLDGADGCGRRFATATALERPDADEAFLADWLDAVRTTALSNRLHKAAYAQPVWRWRYAVWQLHGSDATDDQPNQQRFLDAFANLPAARADEMLGAVPYRMFNCFGRSVHSPHYYEPWVRAGEWPKRTYSYLVGGVCGELSTFASCCANAHGVPSAPVGQPGHCAFARRLPDGTWRIGNFISPPTGFPGFWPNARHWTYTIAAEATFEGEREARLDADRWLELARLAARRGAPAAKVMRLYRHACNAWPGHYTAWRAYGDWIMRANRPLEEHRTYARAAINALNGWRHPLWDLLTPYFDRVARESGPDALAEALESFVPLLRQPDETLQDDGDISLVVARWAKPLVGRAELMERAVGSVVAAQYGTKTYFAQVLGWCAPFIFADEARAARFLKTLPKLAATFAKEMRGKIGGAQAVAAAKNGRPDLGTFILAAENGGNVAAFRQFAAMQEKIGRPVQGPRFKERDFGGELVSAEGMLTISKTCPADTPALHPRALDASPVQDVTFTTQQWAEPWAMVTLAGPCSLRGIAVILRSPDEARRKRQLPLAVEVSENGVAWRTVLEDARLRDQYRVEFSLAKAPRARYVRVRRSRSETEDGREQKESFSLSKILVYGKKLY